MKTNVIIFCPANDAKNANELLRLINADDRMECKFQLEKEVIPKQPTTQGTRDITLWVFIAKLDEEKATSRNISRIGGLIEQSWNEISSRLPVVE